MSNPFNTLNPMNNYDMGSIQNAYRALTTSNNPMQVFQQMAMNNPRLQPVLNMLNQGANPQQLFVNMCQQRGIDPNAFIRNITGRR